jgi:hypothetical protein
MWINRCGIGVYYKDEIFGFGKRPDVSSFHIESQEIRKDVLQIQQSIGQVDISISVDRNAKSDAFFYLPGLSNFDFNSCSRF